MSGKRGGEDDRKNEKVRKGGSFERIDSSQIK